MAKKRKVALKKPKQVGELKAGKLARDLTIWSWNPVERMHHPKIRIVSFSADGQNAHCRWDDEARVGLFWRSVSDLAPVGE